MESFGDGSGMDVDYDGSFDDDTEEGVDDGGGDQNGGMSDDQDDGFGNPLNEASAQSSAEHGQLLDDDGDRNMDRLDRRNTTVQLHDTETNNPPLSETNNPSLSETNSPSQSDTINLNTLPLRSPCASPHF